MTHPPICERCGNDYAESGRLCLDCAHIAAVLISRVVINVTVPKPKEKR